MAFKYIKADTPIHRLHLLVKLIYVGLTLVLVILSTSFKDSIILIPWLIFTLVLWRIGRLSIKYMGVVIKIMAGLIIFLTMVQAFMYRGETPLLVLGHLKIWGGADLGVITYEGLMFGLFISLKIVTAVTAIPLFVMSVSPSKLMDFLVKIKIPYTYSFALVSALRFSPLILELWNRIIEAQKLRAFDIDSMNIFKKAFKGYVPITIPLIVLLLRKGNDIQIAIESRGFGAPLQRTLLEDVSFKKTDYVWLIVICAFFILLIVLKLFYMNSLYTILRNILFHF